SLIVSAACWAQLSSGSIVASAALMPPAASEVCASSFGRLPTARTSTPDSATSIAALRPDPPVPMTSTEVATACSLRRDCPCVVFMASTLGSPNTYVQCIVCLKLIAVRYRYESRTAGQFRRGRRHRPFHEGGRRPAPGSALAEPPDLDAGEGARRRA